MVRKTLVDMTKFRYVVFDFDNTLAGHTRYVVSERDYTAEMVRYLKGGEPFINAEANFQLQKYMDLLLERHVPMGLCSAISDNPVALRAEAKVQWVQQHYAHSLRNLCVSGMTAKAQMLEILQESLGCEAEDILMIDDSGEVLEDCASRGFSVCTPMHIVNLINREVG